MAHHRYKTHEELVNTPRVTVDLKDPGFAHYTLSGSPYQGVVVDLANNSILGKKINFPDDQYFGDWFCVFVPDEVVSSPPEDVFTDKYRPTSRLDHYSDSYDGTKKVESSASDEELRYKCIKEAQRFFQEGCYSPELLIKAAEKIYKFIKQ